jgi:DNA polymerase-3 subunit gamma/tau
MAEYQVLARRYRPQRFSDIIGQDALVTTLLHAMRSGRLAQAYLFAGSRGTGKTTTARIFAKALNCKSRTPEGEPCNQCSSCREITEGNSLDVLEIDGASHRGIEDIRTINETAGYATASGMYKIYIIDEVHMLTKEAFNALLKTLEEPPEKVKFFFATTEPHKMLPTILSRCQRFNLNRIPVDLIVSKLRDISKDLGVEADDEALLLVANRSEGGLRDAESLFDQVLAFHEGKVTAEAVAAVLGVVSRDIYFEIDHAGKAGDYGKAFEIVNRVYAEGKDLLHFVEGLVEHFRNILLVGIAGPTAPYMSLSEKEREQYASSAKIYRKEQCMDLLDFLIDVQGKVRFAPSVKIMLETILLRVMRSHQRIPIEVLVRKLTELQSGSPSLQAISASPTSSVAAVAPQVTAAAPVPPVATISTKPRTGPNNAHDNMLQFAAVELEGRIKKH